MDKAPELRGIECVTRCPICSNGVTFKFANIKGRQTAYAKCSRCGSLVRHMIHRYEGKDMNRPRVKDRLYLAALIIVALTAGAIAIYADYTLHVMMTRSALSLISME